MKKPTDIQLWIYDNAPITQIRVDYEMTGCDTADVNVTLTGVTGKRKVNHDLIKGIIDLGIGHNYVLELNRMAESEVKEWLAFEKENKKDLAELKRLKKKLELD